MGCGEVKFQNNSVKEIDAKTKDQKGIEINENGMVWIQGG